MTSRIHRGHVFQLAYSLDFPVEGDYVVIAAVKGPSTNNEWEDHSLTLDTTPDGRPLWTGEIVFNSTGWHSVSYRIVGAESTIIGSNDALVHVYDEASVIVSNATSRVM